MTWPLALGLRRDIPWDLGDSVLNCWILQWGADHLLRFLGGDFHALSGYFNGNIFYPEPLTLAYSEHLTAQVLQILPVYAVTKNIVLCYNLLFLSTFVLSGLGAFLLVRELTGSPRAAFVAGLLYAFAPYRIGQFSHLQVLSSQWMPFALYALRRYFDTRRLRPLAGAVAALVAQNLSSGYFLLYFAPFAAAYVLYEIADRGAVARLAAVGRAGGGGRGGGWPSRSPFLLPYLELRALGFGPRPMDEVVQLLGRRLQLPDGPRSPARLGLARAGVPEARRRAVPVADSRPARAGRHRRPRPRRLEGLRGTPPPAKSLPE